MRNTNLRAVLFSLIAVVAVAACDAPEASPAAEFRVLPGGYWTDGDDGCEGKYLKTESGSMCLPPWGDPACNAPQVDECGHQVGGNPIGVGTFCTYWCNGDAECLSGQRCDPESSQCVWQTMPVPILFAVTPGEFGSCESGNLNECPAGHCTENEVGSWCAADCVSDSQCVYGSPVNECAENAPAKCVAGQCKIACDGNGGCWGLDGMACDGSICVWAGAY